MESLLLHVVFLHVVLLGVGFLGGSKRIKENAIILRQPFSLETSMRILTVVLFAVLTIPFAAAQQNQDATPESTKQSASKKDKKPAPANAATPDKSAESGKPAESPNAEIGEATDKDKDKEEHYDVAEVPPVITHHQIALNGKTLNYTATAGRLPIKRGDGKTEAEMFFVAYTLDGQEAAKRPLTFSFNGGPGSASVWLHMGALGPKRVVLQPNGFMPAAPYRLEDNPDTLLDRSDIVMVDAMATGYSRAATAELTKKFLGVKGDVQAFGEFIRLYISRYDRWSSPLFLLGESYGTTRAAGIAGYLADHGIAFNGVTLLSMALDFQTLEWNKSNDLPYFSAGAHFQHDRRLPSQAGCRSHPGCGEDARGSRALVVQ